MLSIKNVVDQYARSAGRQWSEDRSQTVGASEIGQCARKTWFGKFENDVASAVKRDEGEDRWGARVRGTIYENYWWEPALRAAYGSYLLLAGDDQRTLFEGYLSATPDGLITGLSDDALQHLGVPRIDGGCIAVECKTADPRTRLDHAKPEHRYQVIVQLGLIRARTQHQPSHGLLSYTDTSFWDDVLEFPIAFDQTVFDTALARAAEIMTATSAVQLKPEGRIAGGRECEYCAFRGACGQVSVARLDALADRAPIAPDLAAAISDKAARAKSLKGQAGELEAQAKGLEEEIKTDLTAAGTRSLRDGGVSVSWSSVKGRPSTDWKALREAAEEAGVDTQAFTTVGDPTDRLTITIREQQNESQAA